MNTRQQQFCLEYAKGKSATQAYIDAGYSPRGAGQGAERLLRKVDIQERIALLREEVKMATIATVREVQELLTSMMRDETLATSDRLKASIELGKMIGAYDRHTTDAGNSAEWIRQLEEAKKRYGDN